MNDNITRRKFLITGIGSFVALALGGCIKKDEKSSLSNGEDSSNVPIVTQDLSTQPTSIPPVNDVQVLEAEETPETVSPTATVEVLPPGNKAKKLTCPKGMVNDPFPGLCKRYIDTNGNGICDLSEVEG